ncbi:DUF4126 domain-containing protein [Sphingobacterium thalpophilum]|uniref:DUF4126 domain-containing protein n=1 Tax=Sphingobacterium thalpophilum TaxID=259 RepID=A0A4V6KV19_9SPHI|nr:MULTISPECIES: DUF4126 domain-containing protein [Sphingobacterium]MCW8314042.1 DUF4126 domain-containing protein [Sphingobacterium sp. InxBP1]VTR54748.1 Uncharacterised protein [Sphingobacterium thalpophilum]
MGELSTYFVSAFIGIGLAAATGFRVFMPLFLLSLGSRLELFQVDSEWAWTGSNLVLMTTSVAMLIEVLAFYIPVVDNMLDGLSIPLAAISGTALFALQFTEIDPLFRWSMAILAGGGTAATISTAMAGTRAATSLGTAGLGNFVVATLETIGSTILTILALFVPFMAILVVIGLFYFFWKFGKKQFRRKWRKTKKG